jgi:hypothetical protein
VTGNPRPRGRLALALALGVILASVTLLYALRVQHLADTDPRIDQAFHAVMVQDLRHSSHLLPVAETGQGFLEALQADSSSLLHNLFRRAYNQPYQLFRFSNLGLYYLLGSWYDESFRAMVSIGILGSAAAVLFLSLIPLSLCVVEPRRRRVHLLASLLTLAFASGSFYLHYFSALGAHNVAIALVLANFLATVWAYPPRSPDPLVVRRVSWTVMFVFGLTWLFAVYSYYLLTWLVVPACLAQILAARGRSAAAKPILGHLFFYGLAVLPAALVIAFLFLRGVGPAVDTAIGLGAGALSFSPAGLWTRGVNFFVHGSQLLSAPGLFAALAGLFTLARVGLVFPLVFIAGFFALTLGTRVGTNAWLRAIPYATPMLLLGIAYFTSASIVGAAAALRDSDRSPRNRAGTLLLGALALLCAVSYVGHQAGPLLSIDRLCVRVPLFCQEYVEGESLRPVLLEVEGALPRGAVVVSDDYPLHHLHRALSRRDDLILIRPLDSLWGQLQHGSLRDYAAERGLRRPETSLFLLSHESEESELRGRAWAVFGPAGLGWIGPDAVLERLTLRDTRTRVYGTVALWSLSPSGNKEDTPQKKRAD